MSSTGLRRLEYGGKNMVMNWWRAWSHACLVEPDIVTPTYTITYCRPAIIALILWDKNSLCLFLVLNHGHPHLSNQAYYHLSVMGSKFSSKMMITSQMWCLSPASQMSTVPPSSYITTCVHHVLVFQCHSWRYVSEVNPRCCSSFSLCFKWNLRGTTHLEPLYPLPIKSL